jgi:hypothetical protein
MTANKILGAISKRRAELLLQDWANTQKGDAGRLLRQYPAEIDIPKPDFKKGARPPMVPSSIPLIQRADGTLEEGWPEGPFVEDWKFTEQLEDAAVWASVEKIAECLRKAWDAQDQRRFDWHVWKAVSIAQGVWPMFEHIGKYRTPEEPPERATKVTAALFYFLHNRRLASHCANPDCANPCFIRRGKRQKFCGSDCALPTQRESKRRWWVKNRAKKARKKK